MTHAKRIFWLLWACVSAGSFLAFYTGVACVLKNPVEPQNLFAFLIVSLLFGAVCSALFLLRLKTTVWTFVAGIAFGFFEMFRAFASDLNGWQDLAGLVSLFLWMGTGLTAGILYEIARHFFFPVQAKNRADFPALFRRIPHKLLPRRKNKTG